MTDDTTAARPPAGWLLDSTTGQIRWWDGARWTEHVKPAEVGEQQVPVTRAMLRTAAQAAAPLAAEDPASSYRAVDPTTTGAAIPPTIEAGIAGPLSTTTGSMGSGRSQPDAFTVPPNYRTAQSYPHASRPLTSKNGPAKASLILILLLVLGVSAIVWFMSGQDPALAMILGLVNIMMVLAAFALAIIGLVIAVRRPTKKRESIFALVVSSLMLIFLVSRLALSLSVTALDGTVLESQIAAWAGQQTGEAFQVSCPAEPSASAGTEFTCTAAGDAGTVWAVQVTVNADDTVGWEVVG